MFARLYRLGIPQPTSNRLSKQVCTPLSACSLSPLHEAGFTVSQRPLHTFVLSFCKSPLHVGDRCKEIVHMTVSLAVSECSLCMGWDVVPEGGLINGVVERFLVNA